MVAFGLHVRIIVLVQLSLVPTGVLCDWFGAIILYMDDVLHFSH